MPEKRNQLDATVTTLDTLRFRFFVTVAMRLILIRDGIAMWGHRSKLEDSQTGIQMPCVVLSGQRRLGARLALPAAQAKASVLILHGIGERLEYWSDAQQFLAQHQIASLLVAYSGYGKSEGAITPANLRQDTIAGYRELQRLVPGSPAFVLGLSMGTGVAIDAAPHLEPPPSGIILCESFSSLRDAAVEVCRSLPVMKYLSRWLAMLMPDVYTTASTVGMIGAPLLIVHSDADELFPVAMARKIFAAAKSNPECDAELVIANGYAHNDAYLQPTPGYWQPILDFIGRRAASSAARPKESPKR